MRVFTEYTEKDTQLTSLAETKTNACDIHVGNDTNIAYIAVRENGAIIRVFVENKGWTTVYDGNFGDEINTHTKSTPMSKNEEENIQDENMDIDE